MNTVFDTITRLRSTSSTNDKLSILQTQKDNDFLRGYLRMMYEPKVNFWVKKVQPELMTMSMLGLSANMESEEFKEATLMEVYKTIALRELTGDKARRWLAALWHELNKEGRELLTLLIQRDAKAGISTTSINKVWPGLITDVPYMRCALPKDTKLDAWPWKDGIYSQIKADGMFANVTHHPRTGLVSIESRAGSPFPLEYFKALIVEVQRTIPSGQQIHGELLMKDKTGKVLAREVGNGMFNSILQGGDLEPGFQPVFHAWDMIPVEEAKAKNKYKVPYKERFKELNRRFVFMMDADYNLTHLELIEYKMVYSLAEAYAHCKEAMARGLEGTVIKHPEAIWEDSTSKGQIKLKLEFEVDLVVKGFNPADPKSKNAATFGSLQCETSDGKLKVGVTGIKDDRRKAIKEDEANWCSGKKIITVTANGIMIPTDEDRGGFFSLFLPRFTEERLDKTEADSLERVQEIQRAAIETGAKTQ